jgi:hypothetical protein
MKHLRAKGETSPGNSGNISREFQPRPQTAAPHVPAYMADTIADSGHDTSVLDISGWISEHRAHRPRPFVG